MINRRRDNRESRRRLIHRTRDHQSLLQQHRMQHHADRRVIWPPIAGIRDQHTAGISISHLPKASLPNRIDSRFPPVSLDTETRLVAGRTNSCHH